MGGFFVAVGAVTSTLVGLAMGWLAWQIAGNIYGGILGAYRLRRLRTKAEGKPPFGHWKVLRFGLYCWPGRRCKDGFGEYWQIGGMQVPLDGRDPVRRRL